MRLPPKISAPTAQTVLLRGFLEPGYTTAMNVFEAAAAAWRNGRRAALATVIGQAGSAPRSTGARMLIYESGETVGTIGGGALEYAVIAAAQPAIQNGAPIRWHANLSRDLGMCCGGEMEVFIEPIQVRHPFVIFGAGHVAHALAPMLVALDFQVTVVDDRPELTHQERFPGCSIERLAPADYAADLADDERACWFITTHDHRIDQQLCELLLAKRALWVGMIGSRAKVTRFKARLRHAGWAEDTLNRLRTPAGLDIGAETPAEIAVAIAAEIIQRRRQHSPYR